MNGFASHIVSNAVSVENQIVAPIENAVSENKPLKRRKSATKRRSPLKPQINNNSANKLNTQPITVNDENNNDAEKSDDDIDKEKGTAEEEDDKLKSDENQIEDLEKLKNEIGQTPNENVENEPNEIQIPKA